jgi:hypothetical protein
MFDSYFYEKVRNSTKCSEARGVGLGGQVLQGWKAWRDRFQARVLSRTSADTFSMFRLWLRLPLRHTCASRNMWKCVPKRQHLIQLTPTRRSLGPKGQGCEARLGGQLYKQKQEERREVTGRGLPDAVKEWPLDLGVHSGVLRYEPHKQRVLQFVCFSAHKMKSC